MGFLSDFWSCCQKRLRRGGASAGGNGDEDDDGGDSWDLFFELRILQVATNFFSDLNQLGHGGFGPVYKSMSSYDCHILGVIDIVQRQYENYMRFKDTCVHLGFAKTIENYMRFKDTCVHLGFVRFLTLYKGLMPNGEEVAVKKLSLNSRQGVREFSNEVKLLLKIQHKNLVTLFGCCVEGPEKMLVYEYLPNKSLDYFLFDKKKSPSLDWSKRFQIVIGIVRGLLYLHEGAPERIIHRDIKASNILLDEELNPKISDFGLARLFPGEDTHLNTFRISGTHGYMAPEYAIHGYLSVKTDVFSFGVLLLEIVSGRKNNERLLGEEKADLLSYTWTLFQAGKQLELVDESLDASNPDEAAMCIQLGLLCCQSSVADRPDMNSVHLMLSSDSSFALRKPGRPGIVGRRGRWTTTTSTALTNNNTNPSSSTQTGINNGGSSLAEDYSRNSISYSSMDEGR